MSPLCKGFSSERQSEKMGKRRIDGNVRLRVALKSLTGAVAIEAAFLQAAGSNRRPSEVHLLFPPQVPSAF